ncbi:plasminogen-binding N-terminal domain-containing protein [Sulfurimonas sp. MAG313]|nr:plasminogen-binding N-terminal domain-containing protein [Sulfurimonas sp. MAG313]MDF1882239.1 plasminogen-binding N-terminal domain-containing protein [Sulfurimonas sp. MAG313]
MRYILISFFFSSYLLALIVEPIHTRISAINLEDKILEAEAIKGAQVGMYGVIVKHFNDKHATALSWVEVTGIKEGKIHAKMIPIYALEQSALPAGTWVSDVGDELVLGYNYHRALLIAPNPSVYKKVTQYHKEKKWVHPDIFAAVLSTNGHPTPLIEDFSNMCRVNNIGVISFVIDSSILTLDCHSFKILSNKKTLQQNNEVQLPFYTRVTNIESNWFGKGNEELNEYGFYYINLIADNNPDNEWIQNYQKTHYKKNILGQWIQNTESNLTQKTQ